MARRPEREQKNEERDSEFVDRLVAINRVAKVVKGGKNFGFAALVVVGDEKGRAGFGKGKAREVPEAIRKATEEAKRRMQRIPLREGRTLHHNAAGRWGAGKVIVRSAPPGTGLIAGGPMRAVFEVLGIKDVVSKSLGSSNPYNMVRATFDALGEQISPRQVANKRNLKPNTATVVRDSATTANLHRRRASFLTTLWRRGACRRTRLGTFSSRSSAVWSTATVTWWCIATSSPRTCCWMAR